MNFKIILESTFAGIVSAIFSFALLTAPADHAAIAIRHKMPNAWFSGLITWYAQFAVLGISLITAAMAYRIVSKHAAKNPRV